MKLMAKRRAWAVPGPSEADQRRQTAITGDHPHPTLAWAPRVDLRHWEGYACTRKTWMRRQRKAALLALFGLVTSVRARLAAPEAEATTK